MEILMRMFYGGVFVGALIGMTIMCLIFYLVLKFCDGKDE